MGAKKINLLGNLKFSESKSQKNYNFHNKLNKLFKHRIIWCAASTHNTEEKICALAHKKLKIKHKNLLTIIIPRHIQRSNSIINEIEDLNLKVQKRSANNKINENTDIYLVDSYGETKSFYKMCKTVFLGGSLINHGGQNPLEPARVGCKILHGPYVQNFNEVYNFLEKNNLSIKFHNTEQLVNSLKKSLSTKKNFTNKTTKLKKMGSNILNNTLTNINSYL